METVELTVQNDPIKIHAITTGYVSVKTKFRETQQKGILAALSFILDKKFTEWMPIWTWVIEHPEGIFLIDTGENSNITDKDYFKSSGFFANWLNTTQFRFKVNREDEIDHQLGKLGINTKDVETVILTHLHLDHIDGLKHFPNSRIIVNQIEWEQPYGDLPKLYPTWFNPEKIELTEEYMEFQQSACLTKNKDLILVHTPGHTHGHCSVLLKTDQGYILFAGDVVYYEKQLVDDLFAGVNVSFKKAGQTYEMIKRFAKDKPLVFLPSHDAEAAKRLDQMKPLF